MKLVFIDIETLPAADINREFVARKVRRAAARRGEELSDSELSGKTDIAYQNTALHGSLGRLLCIGMAIDNDGRPESPCVCGQDKESGEFHLDEAKTLTQFWNHLDRIRFDPGRDRFVGHNILGFDLPFLYQRSMIFGIRPSRQILNGKPWEIAESVFDTMERWQLGKYYEKIGLEELALAFGLQSPKTGEVTGGNILDSFSQGRHGAIREYCLKDVQCVRGLYYKMTFQKMPD